MWLGEWFLACRPWRRCQHGDVNLTTRFLPAFLATVDNFAERDYFAQAAPDRCPDGHEYFWDPAGRPEGTCNAASAASSNVCPVDDAAEPFVIDVVVTPDDVPADHTGLLLVAGVVGAVQGEVPQRGELRLYAV